MDTIESRLSRVEGSVRRWRGLSILLIVVLAIGIVSGAQKPAGVSDEIKAKKLTIINDKGTHVASMSVNADGGGRVDVYGASQHISLSASRGGSDLSISVGDNIRAHISVDKEGEEPANIFLSDGEGKNVWRKSVSAKGKIIGE
jgi:hypothetical protein